MFKILLQNETGKNLVMYLKQTNLENQLHTSTESPKEDFNDTVFQHVVLKTLVPVLLFIFNMFNVVVISPFRKIFFHNVFCIISFPREFAIFYSLGTIFICNF